MVNGVDKRPELTRDLNPQSFREYYYLKSELADRIETYLRTGERLAPAKSDTGKPTDPSELPMDSIIEENFRCCERRRAFSKVYLAAASSSTRVSSLAQSQRGKDLRGRDFGV
jgi:hypothetical protein